MSLSNSLGRGTRPGARLCLAARVAPWCRGPSIIFMIIIIVIVIVIISIR